MPFIFYKKFIVQKTKSTYGPRSWGIPLYLAASLVPAPEYVCFLKSFSDPEGRFVMVDIKLESKILTLVNIYAPNEDKPTFFQNVLNQLLCFDCSEIILGEDFNLALDVQKDKKGGRPVTHNNSLKEVKHISNVLDFIDIWHCFTPEAKRFTWRRRKPDIHCRLDFFLTSSSLSTSITNADMLPGHKTDRSLISIHSANNANPRGLGF